MRVAIMQPYLFPYVGYFQLLHCADALVLLDDVTYIRRSWINRNRLLVDGAPWLFTIPLAGGSQNRLIRDTRLHADNRARRKLLATMQQQYHAAPGFAAGFPLLAGLLHHPTADLTTLVQASLEGVNAYVGRPVPIVRSSTLAKDPLATGQGRILEICRCLGAREYVNMVGGLGLYSREEFARHGLGLRWLQPTLTPYPQRGAAFVPGLSVIDVLLHNPPGRVRELFLQADLLA